MPLYSQQQQSFDYSQPFTNLAIYNSTASQDVSLPADNEFVTLAGNYSNGIRYLEVYSKNLVATGAPSALVLAVFMMSSTGEKSLLSLIGYSAGENRASVLQGNAFLLANKVFVEVNTKDPGIKFAVRIQADTSSTSVIFDTLPGQFICANPGYSSTQNTLASIFPSSVLPAGLSGNITSVNYSTNALTVSGASFDIDEELRLNFNNLATTAIPHQGISASFTPDDIDTIANTIKVRNSFVDFRLLKNQQVRLRIAAGGTFPSLNGAAMNAITTYFITSCTGNIGDQTITIAADASGIASITNKGMGMLFIFPFPYISCQWKSGNRITIDGGALVSFTQEVPNLPVSLSTIGVGTVITHTAHGYSANQAIVLSGTTAPTGSVFGYTYYVIGSSITANTYKISLTPNGLPVVFTGVGVAVLANGASVTVATGTPSILFSLNNNYLSQLQRITLGGGTLPGASYTYSDLYLSSTGFPSNAFQLSQYKNGSHIAFESAGASVTVNANISGNQAYGINKTKMNVRSVDESQLEFRDSANNLITLTNQGGAFSVTSEATPTITGEIKARPVLVG